MTRKIVHLRFTGKYDKHGKTRELKTSRTRNILYYCTV